MEQFYFRMDNVPALQNRPWIPLRQATTERRETPLTGAAYTEEFIGIASIAVFQDKRAAAEMLNWGDLNLQPHYSGVELAGYRSADLYVDGRFDGQIGINLVIDQHIESEHKNIWHLHPDIVVALGLVREEDSWFRPEEGWSQVVRLYRDDDGAAVLLEAKAEFLSDYLAARGMALYLSSYHQRVAVTPEAPEFSFPNVVQDISVRESREGRISKAGYGDPKDHFRTMGALWRTEWFEPGALSVRTRGDENPHPISFAAAADGTRKTPDELHGTRTWLYFEPSLLLTLMRHRGAVLGWYSQDTGSAGATNNCVHFGINELGLINILAKDIGGLASWEQRLWSAHCVTPEGEVSNELFSAQMLVTPAATVAPEPLLLPALSDLDERFKAKFGQPLLRDHPSVQTIIRRAHRFRAAESDGLLALAKDLTRVFAERIDVEAVRTALGLKAADTKLNSLKAVERLMAKALLEETAKAMMAPLFGIQDLRGADAHLGSSLIKSGMVRTSVDAKQPLVVQGRQLLQSFVITLQEISKALR